MPPSWRWNALLDLEGQYLKHIKTWFGGPTLPPYRTSTLNLIEYDFLQWFDRRMLVSIKYNMIDCVPPALEAVAVEDTIASIDDFVQLTIKIAKDGSLRYLQDTSAAHLSTLGVIIRKVCCRKVTGRVGAESDSCFLACRGLNSAASSNGSRPSWIRARLHPAATRVVRYHSSFATTNA